MHEAVESIDLRLRSAIRYVEQIHDKHPDADLKELWLDLESIREDVVGDVSIEDGSQGAQPADLPESDPQKQRRNKNGNSDARMLKRYHHMGLRARQIDSW